MFIVNWENIKGNFWLGARTWVNHIHLLIFFMRHSPLQQFVDVDPRDFSFSMWYTSYCCVHKSHCMYAPSYIYPFLCDLPYPLYWYCHLSSQVPVLSVEHILLSAISCMDTTANIILIIYGHCQPTYTCSLIHLLCLQKTHMPIDLLFPCVPLQVCCVCSLLSQIRSSDPSHTGEPQQDPQHRRASTPGEPQHRSSLKKNEATRRARDGD